MKLDTQSTILPPEQELEISKAASTILTLCTSSTSLQLSRWWKRTTSVPCVPCLTQGKVKAPNLALSSLKLYSQCGIQASHTATPWS